MISTKTLFGEPSRQSQDPNQKQNGSKSYSIRFASQLDLILLVVDTLTILKMIKLEITNKKTRDSNMYK